MDSMQNAPLCPNGEHQWVDYQCVYCGAQKPEALDEIFQELLALSSDMSLYEIGLREKRARKLGKFSMNGVDFRSWCPCAKRLALSIC